MHSDKTCRCFSCGALVADIPGEVHRYMDSTPGCWQAFGQILEKEYSDPAYWVNHRITVDAYAVQHFGQPVPQAIHSVNLHLASLYLMYEKGYDVKRADLGLTALAKKDKSGMRWLEPPTSVGSLTVADILQAQTAEEHCNLVYQWGKSAWEAWAMHHDTIRQTVEEKLAV